LYGPTVPHDLLSPVLLLIIEQKNPSTPKYYPPADRPSSSIKTLGFPSSSREVLRFVRNAYLATQLKTQKSGINNDIFEYS